jgi:LacI family transcriptional regulator
MYDVARVAGVSLVVNDTPNTNNPQATRERVCAAAAELGWRPNAMARGLSLRRSHTIGLISDEIATSSHTCKIIHGAQDAAWDHTKMLLVVNTGTHGEIERAALEMLLGRMPS